MSPVRQAGTRSRRSVPSPVARQPTPLDRLLPRWDFRERQRIRLAVRSSATAIPAVTEATWGDLPMFRAISAAAGVGRRPGPDGRVFENFLGTGPALAVTADEVVYGWLIQMRRGGAGSDLIHAPADVFADVDRPRTLKIGFNFRYADGLLSTETRVRATDARTRRLFRLYWLLIRVPSALIRHEWLRGVSRRVVAATE